MTLAQRFWRDCLKLHRSVTVWFNSALAFIAFVLPEIELFLPQLKDYLPEDNYKMLMLVALTGNFVIRFKTTKALRDK